MADSVSDDVFARLINQMGIVTLDQIEAGMRQVVESQKAGKPCTLGDVLVSQGIITQVTRENVEKRMQAVQSGGIKQIGPYKIIKKLGQGGMGAVYLADDTIVGRKVALKVLPKQHASDKAFVSRFRREAKSTGQLNHINIVTAFTTGEEMGVHYYVMEYCEGDPLDVLMRREKRLPWDQVLDIGIQVSRGLKHAHDNNLIHRDIKPSNIFLTKDGIAKILDLGLSKSINNADQSFNTQSGIALGTPHYISPEQARADKTIDGRTDIYSLGATLYHLLSGQTPFDGETAAVIMMKHLNAQLPNPQETDPAIPDSVVQVVQRMMAKEPDDRYPDCGALLRDLQLAREGKALATVMEESKSSVAMRKVGVSRRGARGGTGTVRREGKAPAKPNRVPLYIGAGALVLVILLAVLMFSNGKTNTNNEEAIIQPPPPTPPPATTPKPTPTVSATPAAPPTPPTPPKPPENPDPDPPSPPWPAGAKPVDVLKEIDEIDDAFIGHWKRDAKGALFSPVKTKIGSCATIVTPYRLPRRFRIDIELAYLSGTHRGFVVGMPVAARTREAAGIRETLNPFAFTLDEDKRSFLITVDGQKEQPYHYHKTAPETTFTDGPLITDHKRHYLSIEMRDTRFTVSLDNKQVLNWQSPDYSRLGPTYWNRLSKEHLLLGTLDAEWKVTKVLVLDLVGNGQIVHVNTGDESKKER